MFTGGVCDSGGSAAPRFNDCLENFVGTDALRACAATSTPNDEAVDAMPADFNDDQQVNVTGRTLLVLALKAYNGGAYNQRFDLNADGAINVTDLTIVHRPVGTSVGSDETRESNRSGDATVKAARLGVRVVKKSAFCPLNKYAVLEQLGVITESGDNRES